MYKNGGREHTMAPVRHYCLLFFPTIGYPSIFIVDIRFFFPPKKTNLFSSSLFTIFSFDKFVFCCCFLVSQKKNKWLIWMF